MTKQLNVFVENRPGRLESVTERLLESNINVRAFAMQDRGDFGLLKLIVDKPQEAYLALCEKGFACALKDTLAISVPDKLGNLHKLATILAQNNINVIDAYGFVLEPDHRGVCCLEIENLKASNAQEIVAKSGFRVLSAEELTEL
jgi:hypothetical protein